MPRSAPHPESLNNLANVLSTRFGKLGQRMGLDEVISLRRAVDKLLPAHHPDLSNSLSDLAAALSTRFGQSGQHDDLDETISFLQEALVLCSAPHPDRFRTLTNLAKVHFTRFSQSGQRSDLDEAISLLQEACSRSTFPLYALIIGIDNYKSDGIPKLRGCVNDAEAIKRFLVEKLLVPDSRIMLLANERATRSAIISGFRSHLINNNEIQRNDSIVIFYAGHGSRVAAPDGWIAADGHIETICPYDERTNNSKGEPIHGIPDRTINKLLSELSSVKGNNITFIVDSCHSGGMTRQLFNEDSYTARLVATTRPIPANLDSDILTSRSNRSAQECIPAGFQYKSMESHVLLAACQQGQLALERVYEGRPHGIFTFNLVEQLRRVPLDRTTYSELSDLLPVLRNQNPHCEGTNKHKILFRGKVKDEYTKTFRVVIHSNGRLEVNAGRIHGVNLDSEFIILDQNAASTSTKGLGVLIANPVNEIFSALKPRDGDKPFHVPVGARAVVSDWKNNAFTLKVFVEPGLGDPLAAYLFPTEPQRDGATRNPKRNFIRVTSRSMAHVVIWLDSGELVIERLDPLISKYANPTARFNLQNRFEHLPDMLEAVAHFNSHLGRYHGRNPLGGKVGMELHRLTGTWPNHTPDTRFGNPFRDEDEVLKATLVMDKDARYGVAMVNHTQCDLFPYLFCFNSSSYSIESWYEPAAPLRGQQVPDPPRVTSGYGAGGGYAYEFDVPEGQSSDTVFLKLFVSTKRVDLSSIAQEALLGPNLSSIAQEALLGPNLSPIVQEALPSPALSSIAQDLLGPKLSSIFQEVPPGPRLQPRKLKHEEPITCDAWIAAIIVNRAP